VIWWEWPARGQAKVWLSSFLSSNAWADDILPLSELGPSSFYPPGNLPSKSLESARSLYAVGGMMGASMLAIRPGTNLKAGIGVKVSVGAWWSEARAWRSNSK